MRRLLLVAALLLAGCTTGPSDAARAWCKENPWSVQTAANELHVNPWAGGPDYDKACMAAFKG